MVKLEALIQDKPGERLVVLGNEAIARGLIETGINAMFSYPGTPSSEISGTLSAVAAKVGFYAEYSANEKIALEGAAGFAMAGLRAVFVAKHVGINVAADALMTLAYSGCRGGLVIITADDPGCHSSQNEQDNRWLGRLSNLPVIEPVDAQDAQLLVKKAFEISEKFELPVIFRITTRIAHSRSDITLDKIKPRNELPEKFEKEPTRFVCVPAHARKNHSRLLKAIRELQLWVECCDLNREEDGTNKTTGIITSGVSYTYVKEALAELGLDFPILKIGLSNPLPEDLIGNFLQKVDRAIMVEEGDPYLETFVSAIESDWQLKTSVLGKKHNVTPYEGELNIKIVKSGIYNVLVEEQVIIDDGSEILEIKPTINPELQIARPPTLCSGCPHRGTFYAINKATKRRRKTVISTDIGCYTLGVQPPLQIGDMVICMGSSIGIANGLSHSGIDEDVIAVIGDSTFWHSGLTELANAIYNNANMTIVVVDNLTTAMTGMQEHPGTGKTAMGTPAPVLTIGFVAKSLGIEHIKRTSAFNIKQTTEAIKEAIAYEGTSVIISEGACMLNQMRDRRRLSEEKKAKLPKIMQVDPEKCTGCTTCISRFACPAIWWSEKKTEKGKSIPKVDPTLCQPCRVCAQVCPADAYYETEEDNY
ncbi:MAG: indolepyruvate ferredoxin oxidoreductase subunit alpha [Candidatus Hodarchaeales archaeon]|jgi:indolepyruvate ferredoxin oxidoreductase alpha subunit